MKRSERYEAVLNHFAEAMPHVTTELEFGSVFQLLVATMLSAQCTDKRVNLVTPELFSHYPDARTMGEADEEDVLQYIRSVSYPNAKARHLVQMARMLTEKHQGNVPETLDELVALPGVGRKTANVMLAVAFNKAAMPVDTHVFRVSHRLGLVPKSCTTPLSVERYLKKNIPERLVADAHHWLLLHGRYVCVSRKPKCGECAFQVFCPSSDAAQQKED